MSCKTLLSFQVLQVVYILKTYLYFVEFIATNFPCHQVLPERTHPLVTMPGNRGFILSGIKVIDN